MSGDESADWGDPPAATSIEVFDTFAADLGEALRRARSEKRLLYGYVEHSVATTYLATSGGLRIRHEQPSGQVGITGKPADLSTSAWVGQASDDFSDVDVPALETSWSGGSAGPLGRWLFRRGATRRCSPRPRSPT